MSNITPQLVKELREKSGAGMMDCKKALTEVNGDLEAAIDWLRKKGLAAAGKKAGRVAAEGLVAVCVANKSASIIELNSETDFVARNTDFQNMAHEIAKITCEQSINATLENVLDANCNTSNVRDELSKLIGVIGENMNLRRVQKLEVNNGTVCSYIHNAVAPNLGKIGVLVALESNADVKKLEELGKKIAMHIAAASPQALNIESLDADILEREKNVLIDQAKASNRPQDVIDKMVEGRIRKFYEEIILLEQVFVMDGKTKVKDFIANTAKELGSNIELKAYVKFVLGEGIEKQETDFAAEVKAQANM